MLEEGTKSLPLTVSVKAALPAVALVGDREEIVGAGLVDSLPEEEVIEGAAVALEEDLERPAGVGLRPQGELFVGQIAEIHGHPYRRTRRRAG